MNTYNVQYVTGGSSGTTTVKAESFSDAKDIYESKNGRHVVYKVVQVGGGSKSIEYMSYSEAVNLAKG